MLALLALTAAITGCANDEQPVSDSDRRPAAVSTPAEVWTAIKDCPVTYPSAEPPVEGEDFNYGNRHLAVFLWPKGRLVADRVPDGSSWAEVGPDGTIAAKVAWWRERPGA